MGENGDLSLGYLMGSNENKGGGGFGGGWGDGIWAVIILAILFGRGGFGGFGGLGGGGGDGVSAGFAWQGIDSGIRGIQQGLCDGFYAVNTGLLTGFNGVQSQLAECCCATQRAIDGVNFNLAKGFCDLGNVVNMQTRDIIDNQNANYRGIMDFLVTEKLASKDAKIAELNNQLSQSQQNAVIRAAIDASTAEIIRRTGNDCPTPAYWVSPPTPVAVPAGCGCGCG